MGQITPGEQFLFYIQNDGQDPQFIFKKNNDGLEPIDVNSQEASSIASVIGVENYQSLVATVRQSREKITDDKGNQTYLVKIEDASKITQIKGTELVTLRNVDQLAKAVKEKQHSRLSPQFSRDFLQKAHLLVEENEGLSPLGQISKNSSPKPYSEITCSSESAGAFSNESVDLDHDTVTIDGITYKITYSLYDKQQDLSKVPPQQKEAFLFTVRDSIIEANKLSTNGAAKKVVLSFNSKSELTEVKSYVKDQLTPALRLTSNDKLIQTFKTDLRDVLLSVNESVSRQHKTPLAVNGVPRASQHLSCWFGSGLQMAAHLFGNVLERSRQQLKDDDATVPDHIERFVHMKRKILGEERGPILDKEVTELHAALVDEGILNAANYPLDTQKAPEDFINALLNREPFNEFKNYTITGNSPGNLKDLLEAKINDELDPEQQFGDETEISVVIERNNEAQKTANKIALEKTLILKNANNDDCEFELVGAVEHIGDLAQSGHYISYSFQNGKWYKCNDAQVSEVTDEKALLEHLSSNSTQLVYRKLPQKTDTTLEEEIAALHSLSAVDTDKWVKAKVVIDWVKKQAANRVPQTSVIIKNEQNSEVFKAGPNVDLSELQGHIDQVPQGQRAFIPLIKVNGPNDHISKHFVALVVDKSQDPPPRYEYFDSTGRAAPSELESLASNGATFNQVIQESTKWQHDGFRCGYYVSRFFELRATMAAQAIADETKERYPDTKSVDDLRLRMRLNYNRFNENYGFLQA
jgi:hypothetical protein